MTIGQVTVERVLDRLGFAQAPARDAGGLAAVYLAWCRNVPFDNLVKRIHLASGSAEPFPNGPPEAFFASYLEHGTGGTCWPSSGALFALLDALGFDVRRGSAAMGDDGTGDRLHSHGTVIARLDGGEFWVDSSMLTDRPLPLRHDSTTRLDDRINPVRAEPVGDGWRVIWRFAIADGEMPCFLLDDDVDEAHYLARYDWSRDNGPFNAAVYATRNFEGRKVTIAFGRRFEKTADGVASAPLGDDRTKVLVEEFGYSEAIVAALPDDDPPPVPSNP
jgi:N-hydroxyarylamine O-acetyltransferase